MISCENCGAELPDEAVQCDKCGAEFIEGSLPTEPSEYQTPPQLSQTPPPYQSAQQPQWQGQGAPMWSAPAKHDIPKCTCCGYIGPWKMEPIIRPMDWVIGIALFIFACGSGLIYLGVVAAIRANQDNRAKLCAHCGARNLFTFIY